MNLKNEIKTFAQHEGIDLVGFASKERFSELEPKLNPFAIFPEGKTVILLGQRITRGSLRGVEEGSNFSDYNFYGYRQLDDVFTAQSCYDIVCFVEDRGWEAVPVFPNPIEYGGSGVAVSDDKERPDITPDFKYAAIACGLGELGINGEVLNKRFGTRVRFQMIITDAEIESDPIVNHNLCDKCGKCAKACPLEAIDISNPDIIEVCGIKAEVAKIDYDKCRICKNGAVGNRLYKAGKPDRIAAVCNRTCLVHLEENGKLSNIFENSFRTREEWTLDIMGKPEVKK